MTAARPLAHRLVRAWAGALLHGFYRIEFHGPPLAPDAPVLLIANHQNGLADGALLLLATERPLRVLVKYQLLGMPLLGWLFRALGALPVYRQKDGVDRSQNHAAFGAVHAALAARSAVALFPEGSSHSEPRLAELKTGVARLALGALAEHGAGLGLQIVPVGLWYPGAGRARRADRSAAVPERGRRRGPRRRGAPDGARAGRTRAGFGGAARGPRAGTLRCGHRAPGARRRAGSRPDPAPGCAPAPAGRAGRPALVPDRSAFGHPAARPAARGGQPVEPLLLVAARHGLLSLIAVTTLLLAATPLFPLWWLTLIWLSAGIGAPGLAPALLLPALAAWSRFAAGRAR